MMYRYAYVLSSAHLGGPSLCIIKQRRSGLRRQMGWSHSRQRYWAEEKTQVIGQVQSLGSVLRRAGAHTQGLALTGWLHLASDISSHR